MEKMISSSSSTIASWFISKNDTPSGVLSLDQFPDCPTNRLQIRHTHLLVFTGDDNAPGAALESLEDGFIDFLRIGRRTARHVEAHAAKDLRFARPAGYAAFSFPIDIIHREP